MQFISFETALKLVKQGKKIAFRGWNGKAQFIKRYKPNSMSQLTVPMLVIVTAAGNTYPWTPTHVEVFEDGWYEVLGINGELL